MKKNETCNLILRFVNENHQLVSWWKTNLKTYKVTRVPAGKLKHNDDELFNKTFLEP